MGQVRTLCHSKHDMPSSLAAKSQQTKSKPNQSELCSGNICFRNCFLFILPIAFLGISSTTLRMRGT